VGAVKKPDLLQRIEIKFEDLQTDADREAYQRSVKLLAKIALRIMAERQQQEVSDGENR
jgi:hypothetical protein